MELDWLCIAAVTSSYAALAWNLIRWHHEENKKDGE